MKYEQDLGTNPFKYGVVGGGDIHTGIVSHEEYAHTGEHNLKSATSKQRITESRVGEPSKIEQGSAGLSCVWAGDNTREEIFAAMERKETWATSGPRIQARIFGGYDFTQADLDATVWDQIGYERGVPMGGDLMAPGAAGEKPTFMIWAQKGPNSGNLDRIQVVKGWVDGDGNLRERITNVVWSNSPVERNTWDATFTSNGEVIAEYDTLPAIGTDHVNIDTADYSNDNVGSSSLKTLWVDEDFDPALSTFYYLRVLEIPTPRWSTYDAAELGIIPPGRFPTTIQERAWT